MVREFKLCVGLWTDSLEPAWDFLSAPPSLGPSLSHVRTRALVLALSQINKLKKNAGVTWVAQSVK